MSETKGTDFDHLRQIRIKDAVASLHSALDLPQEELTITEAVISALVERVVDDIKSQIRQIALQFKSKQDTRTPHNKPIMHRIGRNLAIRDVVKAIEQL